MKQIQTALINALLFLAFMHACVATAFPELEGRWLQHIDNARYEFMNGTGE